MVSDRIDFLAGRASNPGSGQIAFRQQGIMPRSVILPLLAEKLRERGKLVTIAWF